MFMTQSWFYSDHSFAHIAMHCTMYTHCFSISEKTSDEIVMTMLAAGTSGH